MASVAFNADCMEIMKQYPDGYFDLAVVDPPYGDAGGALCPARGSVGGSTVTRTGGKWAAKFGKKT